VMRESVQTALSWIRSHAAELGLERTRSSESVHSSAPPTATPSSASGGLTIRAGGGVGGDDGDDDDDDEEAEELPQSINQSEAEELPAAHALYPRQALSLGLVATSTGFAAHSTDTRMSHVLSPDSCALLHSRALSLLDGLDVHVHFPAGAIRKDGPSAGVTTLVALVSLFTGRLTRSDTAMSGEISLRGHMLPVGGVREKVLAAHAAGVCRVLLPHPNLKDLEELPAKVREAMDFVWCETIEQALDGAFELPVDSVDSQPVGTVRSCLPVTAGSVRSAPHQEAGKRAYQVGELPSEDTAATGEALTAQPGREPGAPLDTVQATGTWQVVASRL